ncbi:glycosyl hydrolase family 28-related protein [Cohnella soli]|uniref:Glycosyl hydrolase family 28-related protein n=1 Tax=Cohnella soli TaxID=425005 RepID=A0ABW0HWN8_9BACL
MSEQNEKQHQPDSSREKGDQGVLISRRKMLAAIGIAGATAAVGTLFPGGIGYAKKESKDSVELLGGAVVSVADISNLKRKDLQDGQLFQLFGYHPGTDIGGGWMYYDASRPKADHNGGTVFSLTVPWNGQQTTLANYLKGTGETNGSGQGCLVRLTESISPVQFGARIDGITNDKAAIQAAIDYVSGNGGGTVEFPSGTALLDGLEQITVTTPWGWTEPYWMLLKGKSNVRVKGQGWSTILKIAGGLVATNASLSNTKGFMVFCDGGNFNIENFSVQDLKIDFNGENNLLPPVNAYGSQSLCPGIWFLGGKNFSVRNVWFDKNPGQQTVVFDRAVDGAEVVNCLFTHNGGTLPGNAQINDHSSIYCLADHYIISGNRLIGRGGRISYESTALEIHGRHGQVFGNLVDSYHAGMIRASFGKDSFNVSVYGNTFYEVSYGLNIDAGAGSRLVVDFYENKITNRSLRPSPGRVNTAVGATMYQFAYVTPSSGNYTEVNILNNEFEQLAPDAYWSIYNKGENSVFEGGKYDSVTYKGNKVTGYQGAVIRSLYLAPARYDFSDNLFINCGFAGEDARPVVHCDNVDAAWSQRIRKISLTGNKFVDVKYTHVFVFYNPLTPEKMEFSGEVSGWLAPYSGHDPSGSDFCRFDYSVGEVNANVPIAFNANSVHGKIKLSYAEETYFFKQKNTAVPWNYAGKTEAAPTAPRYFGDRRGDYYEAVSPAVGGFMRYVCVNDSSGEATLGTWKGAGSIEA